MALYERSHSKKGQIIDASMVNGTAYLGSWFYRSQNLPGTWGKPRGQNLWESNLIFILKLLKIKVLIFNFS